MAYDEHWFNVYLWDFLYYSLKLPHTMDLPGGFDLRTLTALYYGLTTWVDDMVGRVMDGLRANGLLGQHHCRLYLRPWRQPGQPSQVQQGTPHRRVDTHSNDFPRTLAVGGGGQQFAGGANKRHHANRAGSR